MAKARLIFPHLHFVPRLQLATMLAPTLPSADNPLLLLPPGLWRCTPDAADDAARRRRATVVTLMASRSVSMSPSSLDCAARLPRRWGKHPPRCEQVQEAANLTEGDGTRQCRHPPTRGEGNDGAAVRHQKLRRF